MGAKLSKSGDIFLKGVIACSTFAKTSWPE